MPLRGRTVTAQAQSDSMSLTFYSNSSKHKTLDIELNFVIHLMCMLCHGVLVSILKIIYRVLPLLVGIRKVIWPAEISLQQSTKVLTLMSTGSKNILRPNFGLRLLS